MLALPTTAGKIRDAGCTERFVVKQEEQALRSRQRQAQLADEN